MARFAHSACVGGDKLYVFGGIDFEQDYSSVAVCSAWLLSSHPALCAVVFAACARGCFCSVLRLGVVVVVRLALVIGCGEADCIVTQRTLACVVGDRQCCGFIAEKGW